MEVVCSVPLGTADRSLCLSTDVLCRGQIDCTMDATLQYSNMLGILALIASTTVRVFHKRVSIYQKGTLAYSVQTTTDQWRFHPMPTSSSFQRVNGSKSPSPDEDGRLRLPHTDRDRANIASRTPAKCLILRALSVARTGRWIG